MDIQEKKKGVEAEFESLRQRRIQLQEWLQQVDIRLAQLQGKMEAWTELEKADADKAPEAS